MSHLQKKGKKRATAMALKCALEMRKNNEKVKRGKVTIINHLIIHCSYKYFKKNIHRAHDSCQPLLLLKDEMEFIFFFSFF